MSLREHLDNVLTNIERACVDETFAMKTSTFRDRLWYFQTTGRWPQGHDPFFEKLAAQYDIDSTTDPVCEGIKVDSAKGIGLNVRPKPTK